MGVFISDESLRAMYAGGRGNATARRFARLWAVVYRLGLLPKRWVTLEVAGRRSGRMTRFPLGMVMLDRERYLVSMLGEDCNWVRNVRAAHGSVVLWHRRPERCRLAEVPVAERPPIIKNYLDHVPGGRPHIPVDRRAALADFEAIAPRYPVFRVIPAPAPPGRRHWWRWALGGVAALIALVVLAVGLIFKLQPSPAPLALTPAPPPRPGRSAAPGSWQLAHRPDSGSGKAPSGLATTRSDAALSPAAWLIPATR